MSPIVMVICGVLLTAAALTTLVRAERGPSTLDRIVSIDGLVAVVIAMLTIYSAWTGRQDLVVILVVLASVGFVGSVTLARFAAADPPSAEESDAARAELVRERLARVRARMEAEQEAAHRRAGPEGTAEE
ncbi:MAG TPA: monovalent cation/H+ antiporter complex subunit F [Beutenbergiaceae bacterium]|nr:monovalent cation/H+ antiporter complex subunit F [Beutenbergiaceae bacterium]